MPASSNWDALRASETYREFLRAYLEERDLTLSDLARAAGFGRGFPGDVISGKRRLTTNSAFAFETALKLPPPAKKLFRYLVARDEVDVFPELERERLHTVIQELRQKPWSGSNRREVREETVPKLRRVLEDPRAMAVIAASGEPGRGATLAEITKRTGFEVDLGPLVQSLVEVGALAITPSPVRGEDKFEPRDVHTFFKAGERSRLFTRLFQQAARDAGQRAEVATTSETEMFFLSHVCVQEERMGEFKNAFRELVLKFVDQSIASDGDRVVKIVAALHR